MGETRGEALRLNHHLKVMEVCSPEKDEGFGEWLDYLRGLVAAKKAGK